MERKVWFLFVKTENRVVVNTATDDLFNKVFKNGVRDSMNNKYFFYGFTDKKKLFKQFLKERNADNFVVVKKEMDTESFRMFYNHFSYAYLNENLIQMFLAGSHDDQNVKVVPVVTNLNEQFLISDTTDLVSGITNLVWRLSTASYVDINHRINPAMPQFAELFVNCLNNEYSQIISGIMNINDNYDDLVTLNEMRIFILEFYNTFKGKGVE